MSVKKVYITMPIIDKIFEDIRSEIEMKFSDDSQLIALLDCIEKYWTYALFGIEK
jgi:hypothetical protein